MGLPSANGFAALRLGSLPALLLLVAPHGLLADVPSVNGTGPRRAWVDCTPGKGRAGCTVRLGGPTPAGSKLAAWATYSALGAGGWRQFEVTTHSATETGRLLGGTVPEDLQLEAYAAGLAEGALTCKEVAAYWYNVQHSTAKESVEAIKFIQDQDTFVREQARQLAGEDDYWNAVGMVLAQFDGLLVGHNTHCPSEAMTEQDLTLLNLDGDLFDILVAFRPPAVAPKPKLEIADNANDHFVPHAKRKGHCSALFKLLPDHSDIYFGHDTWDTYATASPRIFKTYKLPVRRGGHVVPHTDVFSSSPGYLSSIDDYYTIAGTAELAVIETSLSVNNRSIYAELRPQTVPCWLRVMASNMLAHSATDWVPLFSRLHSGTYNNQWMILDLAIFAASGPATNSFWVLEEAPGTIMAADMSYRLRQDFYWASYNVAYFTDIRALIEEESSWQWDARARLFRELQPNATTIDGMKSVMGWNNYKHSHISQGNPAKAIMARGDLIPGATGAHGAFGGIDTKFSSLSLYKRGMVSVGRVGPTYGDLPPFCWTQQFDSVPQEGQPECFQYDWEHLWPGRSEPLVFV